MNQKMDTGIFAASNVRYGVHHQPVALTKVVNYSTRMSVTTSDFQHLRAVELLKTEIRNLSEERPSVIVSAQFGYLDYDI